MIFLLVLVCVQGRVWELKLKYAAKSNQLCQLSKGSPGHSHDSAAGDADIANSDCMWVLPIGLCAS